MVNTTDPSTRSQNRPQDSFTDERVPNPAIFMVRTVIEFLRILFATRPPGDLRWSKDESQSDIAIRSINAVDLQSINTRPCILVQRGPISYMNMGLGQSGIEGISTRNRSVTYNDVTSGSLSISCISRESVEAENIAYLVSSAFRYLGPALRKKGFLQIKALNIGQDVLIDQEGSQDTTYLVPVMVSCMIEERIVLEKNADRLLEQIVVESLSQI
jgi:hypothetical protein